LISSGFPIAALTSLTVLVEPANARLALRHFWERAGKKSTTSIHDRAVFLSGLAKHWVKAPADQIGELTKLGRGLKVKKGGMTDKNRERLRQFDDTANVDALLNLPFRVLRQVRQKNASGRDEALRVMFALAVEILIVAPMRINYLTGMELDRNIVRTRPGPKGVVHIVIPKEEVKNDEPYEVELPQETADLLAVYLRTYRSRLSSVSSPWLFPNDEGKRRVTERFSTSISEFVLRETGIKMNVHLFRHLAATLHLRANPDDLETSRRILGHRSLTTTMKFYAEIKTSAAFKRYDGMIAAARDSGRSRQASTSKLVGRSA
jgi:integrase